MPILSNSKLGIELYKKEAQALFNSKVLLQQIAKNGQTEHRLQANAAAPSIHDLLLIYGRSHVDKLGNIQESPREKRVSQSGP